jgi:lipopolysaccharide transport system ATP-binding protein
MSRTVIEAQNISKRYFIAARREPYLFLHQEIVKGILAAGRRLRWRREEIWALKEVNFAVEEGDVVGVIGPNGAGKSTLLKVLSRITPPTIGQAVMRGRVASLLEVGFGFHPELTGRENIFLNGAILGMTREETNKKFDQIVSFAEMEKFLDTPIKHYSSGMYVRLAFSIAAHLDAEILLVDEVLSVGDIQFQEKCVGKIGDTIKTGRTVIFVSHNMASLQKLCSRGLFLENGKAVFFGEIEGAVRKYLESLGSLSTSTWSSAGARLPQGMTDQAKILEVALLGEGGRLTNSFFTGDRLIVRIKAFLPNAAEDMQVSFVIKSPAAGNIYHCLTRDAGFYPKGLRGVVVFSAIFPKFSLYPGLYLLDDVWLAKIRNNETADCAKDVLSFKVEPGGNYLSRPVSINTAIIHEIPRWQVATE